MGEIADIEQAILGVASRQHGVLTRAQLLASGLSADRVDGRLKRKQPRPLHRGVYFVGPLVSARAREMAATLACGRGAVVSHCSAARLWQLLPECTGAPVDVSATAGDHTRRPGIRMHRVRLLPSRDIARLDGIPVTSVARTLCDLAAVASRRELERALAEALRRGLANRSSLLARLSRHAGRAGAARLRALLSADLPPALTRSEAEERFLALVRRARLAEPSVNVEVGRYEVDFYWQAERLVVEVDGHAFHSSEQTFELDRRRDAELVAAGLRVIRVTWKQLVNEPEAVLVRLAQALSHGRNTRTAHSARV